jgi:hypothetical protein
MDNQSVGDFIPYPTNRVAGTIADAEQASRVVDELVAAGFDRESIDVLHGPADLRRLDPSGGEHGLFAKLQRSLIRGAAGSEFKRLTHHVEDVQAGKFVVMALARERDSRDLAADILHAHGAEFVGFYGRWAYESLPNAALQTSGSGDYDITVGADTIRIHLGTDGSARLPGSSHTITATRVTTHLWLISWRRNNMALVHALDITTGMAYTSLMEPNGVARHVKGTVTPVSS